MSDANTPKPNPNDDGLARLNQMLSGAVACVVLLVGGALAYQNKESLKLPDRKQAWAGFWKKKLEDKRGLPDFNSPEFKSPFEKELSEVKVDSSTLQGFTYHVDSSSPRDEPISHSDRAAARRAAHPRSGR